MAEKNADYQSTTDDDQACANDSGPFKDDDRTAEDPRASILITSDTQEATGNEDRERSTQMQYVHMREAVTDAGTADQGTADNFNVPVNNFISNSVTIIQGGGNTMNVFNSSKVTQVTQPALDEGMYGSISQTDNCPVDRESLHRHRKFLKGHMEYAYGLNDVILEEQILSDNERSRLKALGNDSYQINKNVLKFLYKKDNATYEKFLNALLESFQSHLRRLIIQDGEFDVNELDRPLTKSQISNMMRMERNILDSLQSQVGDIADELIQVRCINTDHYEEITLTTLRARVRTRTLMSIMRNRSLYHFLLFRQILREINPVVYGFTDIEVPSYTATVNTVNELVDDNFCNISKLPKVSDIEKASPVSIISGIEGVTKKTIEKAVVNNYSVDKYKNSDDPNISDINGLLHGRSIKVYINCPTIESLKELRESVENGSMRSSLENFYNDLLPEGESFRLQVKRVFMVDIKIQEFYQLWDKKCIDSSNAMLDNEFLRNGEAEIGKMFGGREGRFMGIKELILVKSYFWRVSQNVKFSSQRKSETFVNLSGVCRDWMDIIRSKHFRSLIKDVPDRPSAPVVTFVTQNSCILRWNALKFPTKDKSLKFVIQTRMRGINRWIDTLETSELTAKIENLREGSICEFRVIALNKNGASQPGAETCPVCITENRPLENVFKYENLQKIKESIITKAAMLSALRGRQLHLVCTDWWGVIKSARKQWRSLRNQLNVLEFRERIERHKSTLKGNFEYEFGIRETLRSKQIFTDEQLNELDKLNSSLTRMEFNEKLHDMLCESINIKHYRGFMQSLTESLQSHLRATIIKDGGFAADDSNRPLSPDDISDLNNITEKFTQSRKVDIDFLLDTISEHRCLNIYHIKSIREIISRQSDWIQPLIDIVQRRSFLHLQEHYKCVKEVSSGIRSTAKEVNKMKSQCCGIHPDKLVDLYCCECRKLLCYKCHATEHFKHQCKDTSEVAKAKCQILENDEKRIESCIDEKLLNLKAASKAYIQEKSKAKTLIKTSYSELIGHLSKQKSKLLQTLDKIDVTEDILMPSDNDFRQLHCTELNSFLANSRKLMDGGTDCEIIEASDELHSRAIQLIKSEEDSIKNYPKNINLRILEHLTLNIKQLKSVMKRTDLVRTLALSKPTSHALDLEKPITGITVLDDKIFLVIFEQTQVKVYDSRDLSAKTPIDIPNMKDPRGLASCSQDKTLFISDNKLQCIHSVNITSKRVKSWKVDYRNPRGLAMTLEHNLLVTICDLQSRILEYTRDGKLIREVALDRSIQEGYQTVQFSDDQFLTCHGEVYSPHRICVIDTKGRIIKSYGKDKGGGEGQLHVPRSVAIDNNTGLLFVADNVNNRVLMFDKHLTLIGQLQTPADLLNPSRLYFDSASARLFVGDAKRRLIILSAACE